MEFSGWDVAAVATKTVLYAATLGAAGTVLFLAYTTDLLDTPQRVKIRLLLKLQLIVAGLASVLRVSLLTGAMTGEISGMLDRDMASMLLEAGEGLSTSLRMAGLALSAFALVSNRQLQKLALLGAALAASSFAGVGHTRALQPHWPATLCSCLHLIGVAFWAGALFPLLTCTRSTTLQTAWLAKRFGGLAVLVVSLLIAVGLILLWMLAHGHADFWSSGYGILIAAKLLLVTLLLCAAAVNKLLLTPRLMRGDSGALSDLRISIQLEILAGLFIFLVTASFTSLLGPPR